ncbi:MAG: cupredoxin domain-containing protein [Firmicutes bacterium]|nr:cupredoxin domain-containing protein [Bacillota bacterium]
MRKRILALGLAAALAVAVLTACGAGGNKPSGNAAGKNVDVKMTDYAFDPKDITLKKGATVTLVLNNQGSVAHSLFIDPFGVKSDVIAAGQTGKVTFTPNQTGTFPIYCAEPGHKEQGMTGTLIVQ